MCRFLVSLLLTVALAVSAESSREPAESVDWFQVQTRAGTVRGRPEDATIVRRLARDLPRLRDRTARYLQITRRPEVEVWIVEAGDEPGWAVRDAALSDWAVGFAFQGSHRILLRPERSQRGSPLSLAELLAHELGHILIDHATGPRAAEVPRWLHEGLAMQAAGTPPGRSLPKLLLAAAFRTLRPMDELAAEWPRDRRQAELAYAQAHHFVGYLDTRFGPEALGRLLGLIRGGRDFPDAFQTATGLRPSTAETEWLESLHQRAIWILLGTGGSVVWLAASFLVLTGWIRKRMQARETMELWDLEEAEACLSGSDQDPS